MGKYLNEKYCLQRSHTFCKFEIGGGGDKGKIFQEEMLSKTILTTLLQIFCKFIHNKKGQKGPEHPTKCKRAKQPPF